MSSIIVLSASYLLASLVYTAPGGILNETDGYSSKKVQNISLLAVNPTNPQALPLQKYGGDPHGGDPHGCDPHDEQHDGGLPANRDDKDRKAPDDVYGGKYPNGRAPY